ncbi:MAG: glycoside hydrolase family 104 protein, partial [Candidatus Pacebacteria bacterium]|nr:glycoside hydrolase family 104 protein [Candidatus Paceibacterota bacterium]
MPLLNLIGEKESRGNYDAYFGRADNKDVKFTGMTVAEVRKWQEDFVNKGSKSSAVGKYQIIRKTMDSLIDELKLTGQEKFTPELQD